MQANQESVLRKKGQKVEDQDEDKRVMQYILEKDKREADSEQQAMKKKIEREKELSVLRAMQERVSCACHTKVVRCLTFECLLMCSLSTNKLSRMRWGLNEHTKPMSESGDVKKKRQLRSCLNKKSNWDKSDWNNNVIGRWL